MESPSEFGSHGDTAVEDPCEGGKDQSVKGCSPGSSVRSVDVLQPWLPQPAPGFQTVT